MNNTKKILIVFFVFLILILLFLLIFSNNFFNSNKKDIVLKENKNIINNSDLNIVSNLRSIDKSDAFTGDNNAKIEIIVYEDLSDLYSVNLDESLKMVLKDFSGDVKIAFRPYVNKLFPLAMSSYLFLECAKEQNKFFEARDLLLQKVKNNELAEDNFTEYGLDLKLDNNILNRCLKDQRYISKIEKLTKEAEKFGVYGSPVIFIDKELIVGARSFEDSINGGGENLIGLKNIILRHLGNY